MKSELNFSVKFLVCDSLVTISKVYFSALFLRSVSYVESHELGVADCEYQFLSRPHVFVKTKLLLGNNPYKIAINVWT